jgi:hypothetical protein
MAKVHQPEDSLHDFDVRQKNVVFPDKARNDAGLWRGIIERPLNRIGKAGFVLLSLLFLTPGITFLVASFQDPRGWTVILMALSIVVPGFLVIAWATKRALREIAAKKPTKDGWR